MPEHGFTVIENYSSQTVQIVGPEDEITTFPVVGNVSVDEDVDLADVFPTNAGQVGLYFNSEVSGLPEPREGRLIIVDADVAAALPHRHDLVTVRFPENSPTLGGDFVTRGSGLTLRHAEMYSEAV